MIQGDPLKNIRVVLTQPSHPGNIGAAARAMKTMGLQALYLVNPRHFPHDEADRRAAGALDVLEKCRIVDTLDEALDGVSHLCATAMTPRDFGPPTRSPRAHFAHMLREAPGHMPAALPDTAFLFGSERFGMRNEDVYRCHVALSIPSNPQFGSLNIGAALQVIAYEWRLALGGFAAPQTAPANPAHPADAAQVAGMLAHLEESLIALEYLDPAAPKKLMPRLNALFNRAAVTQEEVHILRGIAKAALQQSARAQSQSGPLGAPNETKG